MSALGIAALLTVHNRREKTLACLHALLCAAANDCIVKVYLVDDGSTDGTSKAVQERFPQVTIVQGDGNLYWNGGMRKAFEVAASTGTHNYYLWLNDDTLLNEGTLAPLVAASEEMARKKGAPVVMVGTTTDGASGIPTYGGRLRGEWYRPLFYALVIPGDTPKLCDTMNGNCVLIPAEVVRRVGWLDPAFIHGLGDYDFGFRVRHVGFEIYVAPGLVGTCARNPPDDRQAVVSQSLKGRWRRMKGPKRYPVGAWSVYARRHLGPLWPLFWLRPYIEVFIPWAFKKSL